MDIMLIVFYVILFTGNLSGSVREKRASIESCVKSCVSKCLINNDDPLSLLFLRNYVQRIIRDAQQANFDRQMGTSDSGINDWQIVSN